MTCSKAVADEVPGRTTACLLSVSAREQLPTRKDHLVGLSIYGCIEIYMP